MNDSTINIHHYTFDPLSHPIGRGSYSQVYRGFDTKENRPVAIKIVNEKVNLREIEILKSLHHKYLISVYDVILDKSLYIIMELCNSTLSSIEKPTDETIWKKYFTQILEGLLYLVNQGVYHRDIKPDNVLLIDDTVRLCDFTFTRHLLPTEMTTATICGSPLYMAPELLLQKKYSRRSDIWSLGVMSFYFIYGYPPFTKYNDPLDIFNSIRNSSIKYNTTNKNGVAISTNCKDILKQMLIKNPKQRISWSQLSLHPWITGTEKIITKTIQKATRAESVPIAIYGFGGPPIPTRSGEKSNSGSINSPFNNTPKSIMIGDISVDENYSPSDGSSIEYSEENATKAISCPATLQTNDSTILNTSLRVLRGVFNIF